MSHETKNWFRTLFSENGGIIASVVMVLWLITVFSGGILFWEGSSVDVATAYYEGSAFDRAVLLMLMAVGICVLAFRRTTLLTLLRSNGWLLVAIAFLATSIVWGEYPLIAFKRFVKVVGFIITFFVCFSDKNPLRSVVRSLQWSCGIVVIVSFGCALLFPGTGVEDLGDQGLCWKGMAAHKNQLGLWCSTGMILFLWSYGRPPRGAGKKRFLLLAGISFITLLGSHSTTGAFFGVVGLSLMYGIPFARNHGVAGWGVLLTVPLAIFLLASLFSELAFHESFARILLEIMGKDPTLTGRSEIWKLIIDDNIVHWLVGRGYGTFWLTPEADKVRYMLDWDIYSAHNGYLDLFVQLGAAGCVLMLLLIINAGLGIADLHKHDRYAALLWTSFMGAVLITNLSETNLGILTHEYWFLSALICIRVPEALLSSPGTEPSIGGAS